MKTTPTIWDLLKRVHNDEEGSVSLETILIIGAIAIPILIFLIKVGWPRIKQIFWDSVEDLEGGAREASEGP